MKSIRFVLVSALAVGLAFGCSKKKESVAHAFPDSLVNDELIATVNADTILGSDLKVLAYTTTPALKDSLHSASFNKALLDQMIDRTAFFQEAKASGVTAPDTMLQNIMTQFVARFGGDQHLNETLTTMGLARGDFARAFRRDIVIRSYVQDKVEPTITVEEADARAFYDQNKEHFAAQDSVHVRHIILLAHPDDTDETRAARRTQMESIRKRAVTGESFADLARKYSQDGAAQDGGDLGYFARGMMVKPFEDAAFSLKKGQISPIVETQFGLHLIQCMDKRTAHPGTYEEAKDRIDGMLRQRALNAELQNRLKRDREAAIIKRSYETGA
jgi:peptidyl-prolyl cis-trans isomerase C